MSTLFKVLGLLLLALMVSIPGSAQAAAAATTVYPIVDPATGFLLGGTVNKLWINAAQVAPLLKGGEPYRLYGLKGYVGTVKGSKAESAGAPCDETQVLTL